MNIAGFAVRNWQFTLVISLLFAALGYNSFMSVPRAEDPTFDAPFFTVITIASGMEAAEVEKLVTDRIEDAFNELDDVEKIESTTNAGLSIVNIQFDWALPDMDRKYDEIIREMNRLRPDLPDAVRSVTIRKGEPGQTNIVQFALVGDVSYRELTDRSRDLKDLLEGVVGVRQVEIWGAPNPEVRVALDLARMSRLGVTLDQVTRAIQGENTEIPGGSVQAGGVRYNLKTTGSYNNLYEVADTIVTAAGPNVVYVRDIGEVAWAEEEQVYTTRFNGAKAIFITANQRDGQNVFDVRDGIMKQIDEFRTTLPDDLQLVTGFDQTQAVASRLDQLGTDFLIAVSLVLLTLLPLGLRAALVGVDVGGTVPAGDLPPDVGPLDRVLNIGKLRVEMELVDSETGERIAAMVDKTNLGAGAEVGAEYFSRLERFAAAREAFDEWASRVREFLDSAHELTGADAERANKAYKPYGAEPVSK